jgi:hypothetical protein
MTLQIGDTAPTVSSTASCSYREISRSLLVVQPCLIAQL